MNSASRAKQKYNNKAYDRIQLCIAKGKREEWRAKAEEKGMSLNAYIIACVENCTSEEILCKNEKKERKPYGIREK